MRRAVERLHQRRQHLRNSKTNISDFYLGCFGVGFHQHLVFLAALGHRTHRKVVYDAQIFEPCSNKLGKAFGVVPDLAVKSSAFTLGRQNGCHRVFTHLPDAGWRIA